MSALRPGRGYHFRVLAQNAQGQGPWSQPLQASTAADVPGPPSQPVCSRRTANGFTVKWVAPEVENGAPVVSYRCVKLLLASGTCNIATSHLQLLLGDKGPLVLPFLASFCYVQLWLASNSLCRQTMQVHIHSWSMFVLQTVKGSSCPMSASQGDNIETPSNTVNRVLVSLTCSRVQGLHVSQMQLATCPLHVYVNKA